MHNIQLTFDWSEPITVSTIGVKEVTRRTYKEGVYSFYMDEYDTDAGHWLDLRAVNTYDGDTTLIDHFTSYEDLEHHLSSILGFINATL